jgi:hypothetical protein
MYERNTIVTMLPLILMSSIFSDTIQSPSTSIKMLVCMYMHTCIYKWKEYNSINVTFYIHKWVLHFQIQSKVHPHQSRCWCVCIYTYMYLYMKRIKWKLMLPFISINKFYIFRYNPKSICVDHYRHLNPLRLSYHQWYSLRDYIVSTYG